MRLGTTVCPFCSEAPGPAPAPRAPLRLSRETLTRSAIIFAGAALLQAGCGAAPARTEATPPSTSEEASDDTASTSSEQLGATTPGGGAPLTESTVSPEPADERDEAGGTSVAPPTPMPRQAPSVVPDGDRAEGMSDVEHGPVPMYGTPN